MYLFNGMKKEFNMSFEAVWGFDPDRVIQTVGLPPSEIETDKLAYSAEEQRAARIPPRSARAGL